MKVKNIFKKNQIIIFALAIMICVAGYLNFSRDKTQEKAAENAASMAVGDDIFANVDGESYADISDEDADVVAAADETKDPLAMDEAQAEGEKLITVTDPLSTDQTAANDEQKASDEVATTGDDETAVGTENTNPGEAILASTTINSSYFSTAKLTREQNRAKNKETLMNIISDANVSEEQKEKALDMMVELTAISEKENSIEILLEAKGFSGVVVSIVEDSVDVIVNSPSLTEQDMAIIEDVVLRKTSVEADKIAITNVVTED